MRGLVRSGRLVPALGRRDRRARHAQPGRGHRRRIAGQHRGGGASAPVLGSVGEVDDAGTGGGDPRIATTPTVSSRASRRRATPCGGAIRADVGGMEPRPAARRPGHPPGPGGRRDRRGRRGRAAGLRERDGHGRARVGAARAGRPAGAVAHPPRRRLPGRVGAGRRARRLGRAVGHRGPDPGATAATCGSRCWPAAGSTPPGSRVSSSTCGSRPAATTWPSAPPAGPSSTASCSTCPAAPSTPPWPTSRRPSPPSCRSSASSCGPAGSTWSCSIRPTGRAPTRWRGRPTTWPPGG